MTTAAALAARLRAMPDDALRRLIVARRLPTAAFGTSGPQAVADFFDLAEAFRTDDAIDAAIERLPRAALRALRTSAGTSSDELADAGALGLVDDAGQVDDAVTARLAARDDLDIPDGGPEHPRPVAGDTETVAPDDGTARTIAAEQAFETMTTLAELLRAVGGDLVRELAKGGIGSPLARQLAERSGAPADAVAGRLELLERTGLADASESVWALTDAGNDWLVASWPARWTGLVTRWSDGLDDAVHRVLDTAGGDWTDLVSTGRWTYPAGGRWLDAVLLDVAGTAAALGLTVGGRVTTTGRALFGADDPARVQDTAAQDLPQTVETVYLQHDLTIIAPGPLDPSDDAALRGVADLEAPGLAARYRVSEDSVRRALRNGQDHDGVLAVLERLGGTGVPQPLRYLVDQVAARDGSIVVDTAAGGIGSVVRGTPDQLDLIGVDAELKHLGWERPELAVLASRYPAHVVATALEEQRYPAVLTTDARPPSRPGPPVRRRTAATRSPDAAARDLVDRLRLTTQRGDAEPEQEWLGRQIDIAVRGRTPIRITVRMPDGTETPFSIVPTSMAAGRVRGRDTTVDVERTLPLSLVVRVDSDA